MTIDAQMAQLADELRRVFADERNAIAALDHARLDVLSATKQRLAGELAVLRDQIKPSPALRAMFEGLRVEAHATAMLAAIATEAVRGVLGYEPAAASYDRRARAVNHRTSQVIARY